MFIKNLAYIQSIPSLTFQRYILSVSVTNFCKRSLSTSLYFANTKLFEIDTATIKYVVFKCNNCCEISWQNLNLWNVKTLNCMICFEIFWQFYFLIKDFETIQEMHCWLGVDFFWLQVQSKTVLFDVYLNMEIIKAS